MDEDFRSTCLRTKLSSNLREAEAEPDYLSIIPRFRSLETQILEKSSGCRIPVHLLYEVTGALSECRVFSYERPTAKAAISRKAFFYLIHVPVFGRLFKRRMNQRLDAIEEELENQRLDTNKEKLEVHSHADAPAPAPQAPVVQQSQTTPISDRWDIIGFDEQAAQIEAWLIPSSSDTFTEIAIVGKWGCGKTALAQKVIASPIIEKEFSLIWVCLSGTMPEQEQEERVRVVKCIQEKIGQDKWNELNEKKYLMVLDDAWWSGGIDLDLPKGRGGALILTTRSEEDKGRGGALILTTRRKDDSGYNHVIRLKPQLRDDICGQIFSKAAHLEKKLDPAEPLLSAIQNDVTRNSRGLPLAVKKLGTIIPDLLQQRKHWVPARDLYISAEDGRYWKFINEGTEEVAELVNICWLQIKALLELKMFLLNRKYSGYLVFKLKKQRRRLDMPMWGGVTILNKDEMQQYSTHGDDMISGKLQPNIYIDGDHPGLSLTGPDPWAEAEAGTGWMEIKLGEFFNAEGDGEVVQAKLLECKDGGWKSGLIVKGISFRLN